MAELLPTEGDNTPPPLIPPPLGYLGLGDQYGGTPGIMPPPLQPSGTPDWLSVLGQLGGAAQYPFELAGQVLDAAGHSGVPALRGASKVAQTTMGALNLPGGALSLAAGEPNAQRAFQDNSKTLGGNQAGPLDVGALYRGLAAANAAATSALGSVAQDPNASTGQRIAGAVGNVGLNLLPFAVGGAVRPGTAAARDVAGRVASNPAVQRFASEDLGMGKVNPLSGSNGPWQVVEDGTTWNGTKNVPRYVVKDAAGQVDDRFFGTTPQAMQKIADVKNATAKSGLASDAAASGVTAPTPESVFGDPNAVRVEAAANRLSQSPIGAEIRKMARGEPAAITPEVLNAEVDKQLAAQGAELTDANRQALIQKSAEQAAQTNNITSALGYTGPNAEAGLAHDVASADLVTQLRDAGLTDKEIAPAIGAPEPGAAPVPVRPSRPDPAAGAAKLADDLRAQGATEVEIKGLMGNRYTPPTGPVTAAPAGAAPPPGGGGGFLRGVEQVTGTLKSATTAFAPWHGMFRHNLPFMLKDNAAWRDGWVGGFKAWKDPQLVGDRLAEIKSYLDANPGANELYVGRPGHGAAGGSEDIPSTWLERLPGYGELAKRSGAGFTMANNETRFAAIKNAIESRKALGQPMTQAETAGEAQAINVLGGRGFSTKGPGMQAVARALNVPFFSPQLKVSRVRMYTDAIGALPAYIGSHGTDPVASYKVTGALAHAAGVGAILGAAKLAGFNVNLNPTSPGFLTVDLGPVGGIAGGAAGALGSQVGWTVRSDNGRNIADVSTGEAPIIKAFVQSLWGKPDIAGRMTAPKDKLAPWITLGQNSLSPGIYDAVKLLQGKGVGDISSLFLGMTIADAIKGAGITPSPMYRDGLGRLDNGDLPATPVTQAWGAARDANPGMGDLVAPDKNIGVGPQKIVLDPNETDRLRVLAGQARDQMLSQVVANPAFAGMPPDKQRARLEGAKTASDQQAGASFALELAKSAPDDLGRTRAALVGKSSIGQDAGANADFISNLAIQNTLTPTVKAALDDTRKQPDPLKPGYDLSVNEYLRGGTVMRQYLAAPAFNVGAPQDWAQAAQIGTTLRGVYSQLQKQATQLSTATLKVPLASLPGYTEYIKHFASAVVGGHPAADFLNVDGTPKESVVRVAISRDPLFPHFQDAAHKRDPYYPQAPTAP